MNKDELLESNRIIDNYNYTISRLTEVIHLIDAHNNSKAFKKIEYMSEIRVRCYNINDIKKYYLSIKNKVLNKKKNKRKNIDNIHLALSNHILDIINYIDCNLKK